MGPSDFQPQNIIEIKETTYAKEANRYLNLGWVLLGVFNRQYSEKGYAAEYSLGWEKTNGDVKHPEQTNQEIQWDEKSLEDGIPF